MVGANRAEKSLLHRLVRAQERLGDRLPLPFKFMKFDAEATPRKLAPRWAGTIGQERTVI